MQMFLRYGRLSMVLLLLSAPAVNAAQSVSPVEASALQADKHAVIIDVREDSEWQSEHIPGAIHIPLAELPKRLDELKKYQNSEVITQCRSGKRSLQAQEILKSAGFAKVYNLDGGLNAWDKAGLATE